MASILRSGKFVRYFAGLARNLVFNTHRETEGNVIKHSQALCTTFTHGFASSIQTNDKNLDRSIKKLDQDVRRSGRISRRDIEEVLDEIRLHRTATSSQSLLVIRCCGNLVPEELPEIRTALVQEIWKTLNNLNVLMDISHYNALLRVYLENEHPFSPTEFLADLESKGVEPNRVTYQRLISRYCQEGDINGATRILEFMRAKQLPINEQVFNALITGHSEANDIESAAGILSVMKNTGLEPTADTYTALLCAYAKHGKLDEILSTLDKCETSEIYLLDKDLFDVIYMLSTNGQGDKVDKLIPRLRKTAGYNQDAVNLILRLVNKGQEDVAYEILKTMPRGTRADGQLSDTGAFFIRQLVKTNRPAEKILSICRELQQQGLNNRALIIAAEVATTSGNLDIAVPIFKEIQQNDMPIRQHYFWPLICAQAKVGPAGVLDVLQLMQSEFNISPNSETVRDFVLPNLKERNYDNIVGMLRASGVSVSNAVTSCVFDALKHNRIKDAAALTSTYSVYYQPGLFWRPLVDALIKTQDYQSYVSILRSFYENLPRLQLFRSNEVDADGENIASQSDMLGQFVMDAVNRIRDNRAEAIHEIVSGLVDQGLTMSSVYAQRIQEKLGSLLTPEISTMLDKLATGELAPVPYETRTPRNNVANMSVDQLERIIEQKEAKSENAKGLYGSLLIAYFKANNVEKFEELMKKLESSDFIVSSGQYAQLIELYCNSNNVDKALATYNERKTKEPDFALNDIKTIKVVHELVAGDRIDEAIDFLTSNKRAEKEEDERGFLYSSTCWRILDLLAEKGRDVDVKRMFESMEQNNFIEVNNVVLGPLVKVHLVNNDVPKAVSVFEALSTKYNCTPFKNDLACKLIQMEDATNLQLLTDLSTNVHGEVNSLYDLVFAFVECGRIRQARKILETPGLHSRPQRINVACERYCKEGKSETLEGLVQATKDFNHIDRHEIFYSLLLTYCKDDQPEKALGLWTKIQEEEDVTASDLFLTTLATYLEKKGLEVPFVKPSSAPKNVKTIASPSSTGESNVSKSKVKKLLKSGDLDGAIKAKATSNASGNLNFRDQSKMLELMVQENRLENANELLMKMLKENTYPLPRIFRFYLNKVAESGNYKIIEEISKSITPELKRTTSFDNRLCHAYVMAGKSDEYVDQMIKKFDSAETKEELDLLDQGFPRGAINGIIDTRPDLIPKLEKFAVGLAEKGIYSPINILWMRHIENGKVEAAERIMQNYLINAPKLLFNHTMETACERKDENIAKNLLKALKESKVTERAIGTVHSCIVDVYCLQGKYDEALKAIDNGISDVCLENLNRTSLVKVKDGLEKEGKKFPHKIPDKKASAADTSSSSSSSDDEPPVKK